MDFEVSAKMSIWERLESLPNEALQQVQQIYGEHFPIEVRCALSKWIEEQPWEDLDQDNPQHENYVRTLVQSLVKELHAKSESNDMNFVTKLKLGQAANYFAENYGHNPFILVGIIKQCMQQELRIIQQVENVSPFYFYARDRLLPLVADHQLAIPSRVPFRRRCSLPPR